VIQGFLEFRSGFNTLVCGEKGLTPHVDWIKRPEVPMYAAALHAQFIRSPNLAISKYAMTPFLFFVGSAVSAKELISSLLLLQIFQFYEGRNVFNETHTDAFKRCPQSENSDTNGSAKGASETCAEIWIDGIRDCATEAPNALLGNQSSSEWNIGPAENFHRVRRGISEPFAITHHWSNSHSPNNRFVIALHSPDRNHQTGPPVGPPEKSAAQRAY
jgi:hypothetical protein